MSFEKNLLQMKKLIKKKPAKETSLASFVMPNPPSYLRNWKDAGLEVIENQFGLVFVKKTVYSPQFFHGSFKLLDVFRAFELWNQIEEEHPISTNGQNVVFFDTETTGLKGTGTYIFLSGQLVFKNNQFELTQHLMADPSHETAFLYETGLWKPNQTVITYNGKSFDWPQLETRWTLNRTYLPKLSVPHHIDLLHGSRRVWKGDLTQFKLTSIEVEKLGFKRVGDIPGHLAPIIYLDAVKNGNPHALLKVLHHNEWDILSLLTLFIHSSKLLLEESYTETALTSTNIGKWFADLKMYEKSQDQFDQITSTYEKEEASMAFYYIGFNYKRFNRKEDAYQSFKNALLHLPLQFKINAYEELAKIDEHLFKHFDQAIIYSKEALQLIDVSHELTETKKLKLKKAFEKRLNRLLKKNN